MNPAMLVVLVLVGVVIIISMLQRISRPQPRIFKATPDEAETGRRRQHRFSPPPLPPARTRRTVLPPPLRQVLALAEVQEVPSVLPAKSVVPPAAPVVANLFQVESKAMAPATAELVNLLKDRQTLRNAVLLREVLGEPRCRRRRLR